MSHVEDGDETDGWTTVGGRAPTGRGPGGGRRRSLVRGPGGGRRRSLVRASWLAGAIAVVVVAAGVAAPHLGPVGGAPSPSAGVEQRQQSPLVEPIVARLLAGRDVAAAKAGSGAPVHDPERERQVVADARDLAERVGASPDLVEGVVVDQMAASRALQEALLESWGDDPPAPSRPLEEVRVDITEATERLVRALARPGAACHLDGDDVAAVREGLAGVELGDAVLDDVVAVATRPHCA